MFSSFEVIVIDILSLQAYDNCCESRSEWHKVYELSLTNIATISNMARGTHQSDDRKATYRHLLGFDPKE